MIERAKRVLFRWVPPAAVALLRGLPRHNWEGVYATFAEVPTRGSGYDSPRLAADTVAATRAIIAAHEPRTPNDGGLLAMVASELAATRSPVRIVDFGGGAGIDYVLLRAVTQSRPFPVEYTVVDHPVTCQAASELFDDRSIRFTPSLDAVTHTDIVHASASLAYVEDWRAAVQAFIELRPTFIMFANTLVGEFSTFATAQQNLPETIVPYWFFSRTELVELLASQGYELILEVPTGLDHDHSNFPASRRPGRARSLVFRSVPHDESRRAHDLLK